jgi:hypothetical protein
MEQMIQGYENLYTITNTGDILNIKNGKLIKQVVDRDGYLYCSLRKNKKNKNHFIHRLIATHFIPNPHNKPCINHINFIRSDNRIENIEWVTHKENSQHSGINHQKYKNATIPMGEFTNLHFEAVNNIPKNVGRIVIKRLLNSGKVIEVTRRQLLIGGLPTIYYKNI